MIFRRISGVVVISLILMLSSTACGQKDSLVSKHTILETLKPQVAPKTEKANTIPLKFEPVTVENKIVSINASEIQEIISRHNIEKNQYIIFKIKNDTDGLHSGVIINEKIYDFGYVSKMANENYDDLYSIQELYLYGKHLIKIFGIEGANYAPTNYYYVENQVPQVFLHVEGNPEEIDLDGDGIQEIVETATVGGVLYINLYRFENSSLMVVSLDELLNSAKIDILRDNPKVPNVYFEVIFNNLHNQPKYYKYTKQGLKEIPEPNNKAS